MAKKKSTEVTDAVQKAIALIKSEIANNDGMYPRNGGRVSMAEVCRRAGVAAISMMGVRHRDTTRIDILSWISTLPTSRTRKRNMATSSRLAKCSSESLLTAVVTQFQELYQVEIPRREAERKALLGRLITLEAENALLRAEVSEGRVTSISKKRALR